MSVTFNEEKKIFRLDTEKSTYVMGVSPEGFLGHIYYGDRLFMEADNYLLRMEEPPYTPSVNKREKSAFLDFFPMEYPTGGIGDYRESCLNIRNAAGNMGCELHYTGHEIYKGKKGLKGLPASFATEDEAETLEITLKDADLDLEVVLSYTAFEKENVITRSVRVQNQGKEDLRIEKILSACLDMDNENFSMLSLHGTWARERHIQTGELHYGKQVISSARGESSHQEHPFIALVTNGTEQENGKVYAMHFVYSGNFMAETELCQFDNLRMTMGINPEEFSWLLTPGEEFQAPEVVIVYSGNGLGAMTRSYHDFYRNHLIRSKFKYEKRPILINNWEATYFDFDEDKLVDIARTAKQAGVELFVLDDGWFGARNNDTAGLGDWTPNPARLPQGLAGLSKRINDLGLKFGLWFEPEMVNKDSDLYRAHPDWAVHTPGRRMNHGRNEFLLNFANKDVVDNIYGQMSRLLDEANIAYIKWDMNRFVSEGYDVTRGAEHQGEAYHRYILGVYDLLERLLQRFPDLIIEGCASGGGRFDMGMLYYTPQIWCSDDTDAIERLKIQYGTSYFYPLSAMGAHVSVVPNHQANRITPIETRANVAMFGTFGYELDLNTLSEEEFGKVRSQIEFFKRYREIIHTGDFHRLVSPDGNEQAAWMVVSRDRKTAIVGDYRILLTPNSRYMRLHLRGLDENTQYRVFCTGASSIDGAAFTGAELMRIGMVSSDGSYGEMGDSEPLGKASDFSSRLFVLTAE